MRLALRWLMLLILVLDLASSPWHDHAHDVGTDTQHAASGVYGGSDGSIGGHDADDDHSGHSQAVVRPANLIAKWMMPALAAPLRVATVEFELTLRPPIPPSSPPEVLWPDALRPDGRAPPKLAA